MEAAFGTFGYVLLSIIQFAFPFIGNEGFDSIDKNIDGLYFPLLQHIFLSEITTSVYTAIVFKTI
jgi:hypothetical protein